MANPPEEQIASALERATAFVHAKLDALEEQRLKRTGWRNKVELWTHLARGVGTHSSRIGGRYAGAGG